MADCGWEPNFVTSQPHIQLQSLGRQTFEAAFADIVIGSNSQVMSFSRNRSCDLMARCSVNVLVFFMLHEIYVIQCLLWYLENSKVRWLVINTNVMLIYAIKFSITWIYSFFEQSVLILVKVIEDNLEKIWFSLWRRANVRNIRLYYPYWLYTDHFIFRFVSLLCLRSTLCLFQFGQSAGKQCVAMSLTVISTYSSERYYNLGFDVSKYHIICWK